MIGETDRLALAHLPDVSVTCFQLLAGLRTAMESSYYDKLLASVDVAVRPRFELFELLGDGGKDVIDDALCAVKISLWCASPAGFVPLDQRIE